MNKNKISCEFIYLAFKPWLLDYVIIRNSSIGGSNTISIKKFKAIENKETKSIMFVWARENTILLC